MKLILHVSTFLIGILAINPLAHAHYLWIETPKKSGESGTQKIELYYGEYEESLREISGGRLDEVKTLQTWLLNDGQKQEISLEKKQNHFEGNLKADDTATFLRVQELDRPVQDLKKYDIGIVKPMFYAASFSGQNVTNVPSIPNEKMTLAIYPVQLGSEITLKVFFKNEPLSGAKVFAHAPNTWSKELKTDDSGTVQFQLPWEGQYVFEIIYLEKTPGEYQGAAYEAFRHRATFTWDRMKAA